MASPTIPAVVSDREVNALIATGVGELAQSVSIAADNMHATQCKLAVAATEYDAAIHVAAILKLDSIQRKARRFADGLLTDIANGY